MTALIAMHAIISQSKINTEQESKHSVSSVHATN
jgi:hypothetical protein